MHYTYLNTFYETHLIKILKLILRMSTSFKNYYAKDVAITKLIIVLVNICFKVSQLVEKGKKVTWRIK